jgi:alkylhydroperoxidase family enzyme
MIPLVRPMISNRSFLLAYDGGVVLSVTLMAALAVAAEDANYLPALDDNQAWSRLPPLEQGEQQPLPVWARMLADSLPRTTAAMLELDALHRARSPLGAVLAAKLRKTVAQANRCAYSVACADADLDWVPATDIVDTSVSGGVAEVPDEERSVLAFARRLTLEADTITDEEVARLTNLLGDQKLVALVLLVAHANFQDRMFLALGSVADLGDPLPPLIGRFVKVGKDDGIAVPERIMPQSPTVPLVPERIGDPEWRSLDFAELQRNLDTQRLRAGRIRIPNWEEVVNSIPEEQRPKHPVRILWTLVCRGYQPELAAAWSACMRTFAEESKQDRVFEESVFWIITRTLHCFY